MIPERPEHVNVEKFVKLHGESQHDLMHIPTKDCRKSWLSIRFIPRSLTQMTALCPRSGFRVNSTTLNLKP